MIRAKVVPETVTVHIPFRLVKRGGRKEMHLPDGASSQRKMDNTMMIRVNEVIMSKMAGNSVNTVMSPSNCRLKVYFSPPSAAGATVNTSKP